ncbi:MAG: nicotinate-nucleotide--dimethylbenzimidazole phosphoribosyltransferase [Candidatus Orphnella occulta]|nr:nicotinate-nucleotide--dimethylbenzimidazole phosphoribosyltransferase [Candidatus Orphnella occulta]MDP8297608.1 nicotinate-nucleotide--dimethylbenzimidazole phosphoribosyltransferase [Candidatus Orphnella occulta]
MEKISEVLNNIKAVDHSIDAKTQKRLDNLTKPKGSLGKLEELAKQLVAITGNENPSIKNKVIFTMAGDHGVVEEGVSAFPKEVTSQMVYNFLSGGAGINVLARHVGAKVRVVDMGVAIDLDPHDELLIKKINYGTKNISKGPAMSREEAIRSIEAGIEIFEEEFGFGIDIVAAGEMGIGNTTASSAITTVFVDSPVEELTGRGTGISEESFEKKIELIKQAIEINKPNSRDAIDVLSKVGGFEIGGLCGIILAAASKRVPVVVDGFISTAAALIAYHLEPKVKDYLIAAHSSVERGHKLALKHIGITPLLDLDMRLGEGTGAALAISIIESGVKIMIEMASFEDASVSKENR